MSKFPSIQETRNLVVARLVDDMEKKGLGWEADWRQCFSNRNAITNKPYRGANQLLLSYAQQVRGFSDPRWCTFKQAKDNGWRVKKGARSCQIERWVKFESKNEDKASEEGEHGEGRKAEPLRRLARVGAWNVFNGEEIEGIPVYEPLKLDISQPELWRLSDELEASSRCPIENTKQDQAFYIPSKDRIVLPMREQFSSAVGYIATMAHEMGHSTGVVFDRDQNGVFGSAEYAREELIAELCSLFTCTDLGIEHDPLDGLDEMDPRYEHHAAYLQSWIGALKENPNELFRAASGASRASDLIIGNYCTELLDSGVDLEHHRTWQLLMDSERIPDEAREAYNSRFGDAGEGIDDVMGSALDAAECFASTAEVPMGLDDHGRTESR